jgi:hypothetical protein
MWLNVVSQKYNTYIVLLVYSRWKCVRVVITVAIQNGSRITFVHHTCVSVDLR